MPSLINLIVAIVVAAVVLWLLGLAIPTGIAALVALLVFLVLAFGGAGERFGGGRFGADRGPRDRY